MLKQPQLPLSQSFTLDFETQILPHPPFAVISHLRLETGSDDAGERQPGPKAPVVRMEVGTGSGVHARMGSGTG